MITKNTYDDVYNKGLHMRFGGGYMLNEDLEARVTFTFQSADAELARMGDYGASNLYGQYSDYQTFGLDLGLRKYIDSVADVPRLRRRDDRALDLSTRPT